VLLTSRYASMSTDPHEHFTLLSLTALRMMIIGAVGRRSLRSTGAMLSAALIT
jgi:hypothetical protein